MVYPIALYSVAAVSYTHLDVYKRQASDMLSILGTEVD